MDSPSFTYNMRYQIHWLYVPNRYLILLRLLRTLYSYSAYDDDLGRGPHRPDRLTSHIARTATGPCRFHALGLPAPWSSVFHRDLIGFCLDLFFFFFCFSFSFTFDVFAMCVWTYGQAEEPTLQKKARVDHRQKTLHVDLGSEAMMYRFQCYRASRDPGTMKNLASPRMTDIMQHWQESGDSLDSYV